MLGALGATCCTGLVAAIRTGGGSAAAGASACGDSDIGALALAALGLAAAVRAPVAAARGAGFAAAAWGAALAGVPVSVGSPRTESVLTRCGSLFENVPVGALAAAGAALGGTTPVGIGMLPFGVSGGNTTRGPDLAAGSIGVSSRETI